MALCVSMGIINLLCIPCTFSYISHYSSVDLPVTVNSYIYIGAGNVGVECDSGFTALLDGIIDKQVLRSSSKLNSLVHQSLFNGLQPIDDDSRSATQVYAEDISISLP